MLCAPIRRYTRPTSTRSTCNRLRRLALEMMRLLEPFNPHLTGPVLSGSAGRHAEIHLHLYTDDVKELGVFLLNREIPFRTRETRVWSGDVSAVVPSFLISTRDADYSVTVLGTRHRRQPLRVTSDGRPLERAPIQSVESLVAGARTDRRRLPRDSSVVSGRAHPSGSQRAACKAK